ncbi:MAG: DUF4301 family protein [Saprospiraceae bacterium]
MNLTEKDLLQVQSKGITLEKLKEQIDNFKKGFPLFELKKAATISDGIHRLNEDEIEQIVELYDAQASQLTVSKFVPASGAASRMFKDLFAFMESYDGSEAAKIAFEADKSFYSPYNFIHSLNDFAFYDDLKNALANDKLNIDTLLAEAKYATIVEYLLTDKGLSYGSLPKGLLQFHNYGTENRTPLEEHFVEAANYAKAADKSANLHFTVSPNHRSRFLDKIEKTQATYEADYDTTYHISLSEQEAFTDTIAVNKDFTPFRLADGSILFRPGGHGALIENLNRLDADVVFIKNVDNVVPDSLKADTYTYKKVIGGILLKYRGQIFHYVNALSNNPTEVIINAAISFYENELSTIFPADFHQKTATEKVEVLLQKLNRPIRVCGMVKNEGEPGGGPFWAVNADNSTSLQIVESSQVNQSDETQKSIMMNATHFNPVDLVCSLTDHDGEKFNLLAFRDPQTGFITEKSKDGKELLAQELPGLWNGAMANWNTIFVEVPLITFNPVKKVNDLLRKEHQ